MEQKETPISTVYFLGLGAMGYEMAGHLASVWKKHCRVWNRTYSRSVAHAKQFGSIAVENIDELLLDGDLQVIISCLPTSLIVEDVAKKLVKSLKERKGKFLWVDCTSGVPDQTRRVGDLLKACGTTMLDAPVSGGPRGAHAGTLTVMVGGLLADYKLLGPVLSAVGGKTFHVAETLGSGHALKAVNNAMNSTHLLVAAEGLAALKKMGIEPAKALTVINSSSGRSLQTEERFFTDILDGSFSFGFKMKLMKKDVGICQALLDDVFPKASLLPTTNRLFQEAMETFGPDADYTNAVRMVERKAGVEIRDSKSS